MARHLRWTHWLRLLGSAIILNEAFIRGTSLGERPSTYAGGLALVGLHEFVKRDESKP